MRTGFLVPLFLFLTACNDSKMPKYVELSELRVLTLIVDKPEVNPGETIVVTPLVSDVYEATSLTYEAYGCIDPGISKGAEPSCNGNATKVSLSQGTITAGSNTEMAQNFTGSAPSFSAAIPADVVIFNQRSEIEKFNGLSYLIEYKISNTRGQTVSTVKRVIVSNKTSDQKNLNPVVDQMQSNGTALSSNAYPVSGKYNLTMSFTPASFQTYVLRKDDNSTESRGEELTTTWFITDGTLKYYRSLNSEVNEYTAPDALSTVRKNFLISVSRDSRGGVTYKRVCGGC